MAIGSFVVVCVLSIVANGDLPPTNNRSEAEFYLNGILSERQKLQSGLYTIDGTHVVVPKGSAQPMSRHISLFSAFDANRLRLDNAEEVFTNAADLKVARRKYLRTTTESAVWLEDKGTTWVSKPDAPMVGKYLFLDPRSLGVTTFKYATAINGFMLEKTIQAYLTNGRDLSVVQSADGLAQLLFVSKFEHKQEELRLWVAADKGFTVTRLESRAGAGDGEVIEWRVRETANVSWKQVDETWVPTFCEMKEIRRDGEQSLTLTFDWQSVNQDVDSSYFTIAGFDQAPTTATVIDATGPNPIVVHDPREARIEYIGDYFIRGVLVALNLLVIGLLLLFYLRRRRRAGLSG